MNNVLDPSLILQKTLIRSQGRGCMRKKAPPPKRKQAEGESRPHQDGSGPKNRNPRPLIARRRLSSALGASSAQAADVQNPTRHSWLSAFVQQPFEQDSLPFCRLIWTAGLRQSRNWATVHQQTTGQGLLSTCSLVGLESPLIDSCSQAQGKYSGRCETD